MSGATPERLAFAVIGRQLDAGRPSPDAAACLLRHWRRGVIGSPSTYRIALHLRSRGRWPSSLAARIAHAPSAPDRTAPPLLEHHRTTASCVLLGDRDSGAWLRVRPHRTDAHVWGDLSPGALGREWLLTTVHEALRASGLLPLHCSAAVAPKERFATAFLAPSGTGKSTTLVRLARAGWDPVCEDFAWYDPTSNRLYGWDEQVRLHAAAPGNAGQDTDSPTSAAPKRSLDYAALETRFGVKHRSVAPLGRLVALRRGTGASGWAALSRTETVPVLWEAIGLPLSAFVRAHVAASVARMVDELQRATLHLGETSLPLGPGDLP